MSNYEANPAGLGIGKRFGDRKVGGVVGSFVQNDAQREIVFDLAAHEPMSGVPMTVELPANYLVEEIYLEVETAFVSSSTANLSINGGGALSTALALATAAPMAKVAITGLANLSGTSAVNIVLTGNSTAIGSATGKARVVVRYKAV